MHPELMNYLLEISYIECHPLVRCRISDLDQVNWNTVAPPQLPRDAPIPDIPQPAVPRVYIVGWVKCQLSCPGDLDCFLSHTTAAHPPLWLDSGFNDVLAARAHSHTHRVIWGLQEYAIDSPDWPLMRPNSSNALTIATRAATLFIPWQISSHTLDLTENRAQLFLRLPSSSNMSSTGRLCLFAQFQSLIS